MRGDGVIDATLHESGCFILFGISICLLCPRPRRASEQRRDHPNGKGRSAGGRDYQQDQGAGSTPNISTDDLIALKAAGVSDGIIRALVAPPPKPDNAAPQPAVASPPPDPNDPDAHHDPGVYMMTKEVDGKPKMVFIDRAGAASVHTAGGIGAKMKAEIPGAHAPVRSKEARPVFYMYFPSAENVGGLGETVLSPVHRSSPCSNWRRRKTIARRLSQKRDFFTCPPESMRKKRRDLAHKGYGMACIS